MRRWEEHTWFVKLSRSNKVSSYLLHRTLTCHILKSFTGQERKTEISNVRWVRNTIPTTTNLINCLGTEPTRCVRVPRPVQYSCQQVPVNLLPACTSEYKYVHWLASRRCSTKSKQKGARENDASRVGAIGAGAPQVTGGGSFTCWNISFSNRPNGGLLDS